MIAEGLEAEWNGVSTVLGTTRNLAPKGQPSI